MKGLEKEENKTNRKKLKTKDFFTVTNRLKLHKTIVTLKLRQKQIESQ